MRDTKQMKAVRRVSQEGFGEFMDRLEQPLIGANQKKRDVTDEILYQGNRAKVKWLEKQLTLFSQ